MTDSTPLDSPAIGTSTTDLVESCSIQDPRHAEPPAPPRQPPFALAFSGGGFRASLAALGVPPLPGRRRPPRPGQVGLVRVRRIASRTAPSRSAYPEVESGGLHSRCARAAPRQPVRRANQRDGDAEGDARRHVADRRAAHSHRPPRRHPRRVVLLGSTSGTVPPGCRFIFNAANLHHRRSLRLRARRVRGLRHGPAGDCRERPPARAGGRRVGVLPGSLRARRARPVHLPVLERPHGSRSSTAAPTTTWASSRWTTSTGATGPSICATPASSSRTQAASSGPAPSAASPSSRTSSGRTRSSTASPSSSARGRWSSASRPGRARPKARSHRGRAGASSSGSPRRCREGDRGRVAQGRPEPSKDARRRRSPGLRPPSTSFPAAALRAAHLPGLVADRRDALPVPTRAPPGRAAHADRTRTHDRRRREAARGAAREPPAHARRRAVTRPSGSTICSPARRRGDGGQRARRRPRRRHAGRTESRCEIEVRLTFPTPPPVGERPWRPEGVGLPNERARKLSYIVVDEIVGRTMPTCPSPWPKVDDRGRLVFSDEPALLRAHAASRRSRASGQRPTSARRAPLDRDPHGHRPGRGRADRPVSPHRAGRRTSVRVARPARLRHQRAGARQGEGGLLRRSRAHARPRRRSGDQQEAAAE